VVEGEEGIGKTALVHEALVDASSYDIRIVTGAGIESDQTTSYHAWRSIFTKIFDIDIRFDDIGSQRRKVMRSLPY
jgi:predicted ATPase